MQRNFGVGGPMNKKGDPGKKDSATSAKTTRGYKDKEIKESVDIIKKDPIMKGLSKRTVDRIGREHTKSMKNIDKYAKPSKMGDGTEFYRDRVMKGKMPSKNVTKVNRAKDTESAKSLKGSKKPNVKQQRELKPRKRK